MDFQLTDDQLQLQSMVRDFAAREIAPHVQEWDEASHFPLETIKQLGQLGLMGCIFPDEYGGSGLGYIEYVLAIEELSRVDGSVGIIVAAHTSLCSNHIFLAGSEALPDPSSLYERTIVTERQAIEETYFLGLRMNRGLELLAIKEEFGIAAVDDYREPIADLVSRGLLEIEEGWLRLTAQGRLLSNEVFAAFLRD